MFLTYNAGRAGYRVELVISADKDKKFTPISFFSPGFLQTSSEEKSPMPDKTTFNNIPIVKILTIGFPVGTINKVWVLRLKYSVLSIFREVGSTF